MKNNPYSVLVLDGQWRQALSVTRALGRRGVRVIVGDSSKIALARFSRYCAESVTYPEPVAHPDEFTAFLLDFVRHEKVDMVIPASEPTVELLARYKSAFEPFTCIPLADYDTVLKTLDKSLTFQAMAEAGISCPETWVIRDESEIGPLADTLPFPVIIKPRRATGSLGFRKVASKERFAEIYREVHRTFPFPIVQEFIPAGRGKYSVGIIFDRAGGVKAAFVHKYLRELPCDAGVGTFSCSVRDKTLTDYGIRVLRALSWYGIAEVELKVDPRDGLPKLMEVNPRFWGMSDIAIRSGMDLPWLLFSMAVLDDRTPCTEYREGQYLRWLLPGDILHYISNPDRREIAGDFFRFFDRNTEYYIFSEDDPMPILGVMIVSLIGVFINDEIRMLIKKLVRQFFGRVFRPGQRMAE
ncbi:hypothetical protein DENIS_1893 [Desulfonema ishimotonii]|uniref:ATP-grasp domain-containing protein n=1 Tax=Desulfonema ishimotonii TaxID=45657 RepID=A0A401FVF4_9BACT|nr:hypothetical protein DENIS_1893 [Desulfonema ishimotonii]